MSAADRMMRGVLTLLAVVPWAWSVVVAELDRRQRVSLDDVEPANPRSDEICRALELSDGNRRLLLHRAGNRIRAALEQYFDESHRADA